MPATILIVSSARDLHALAVRRELTKSQCRAFLLPSDEIDSHHLCFEFGKEPYLCIDGKRLYVDEISTIWWRRPSLNQRLSEDVFHADQIDFINRNCAPTLRSFLNNSFSGAWVSSPEATDRAADKLYQLDVAQRHGFRVPGTLISSDPLAVREFYDRYGGNIIIKSVRNSRRVFLSTQRVDIDQLSDEQISVVPSIYQEFIPGTKHLRINCFGELVYAALIETKELDWRPNINVPISAYAIDADLKKKILGLLDAFELKTGVMDLKISERDELVWFEVNPQGQFLFLEPLTNQSLLANFTDFLLRQSYGPAGIQTVVERANWEAPSR